jgi:phosphate transport system substrate-binding protein
MLTLVALTVVGSIGLLGTPAHAANSLTVKGSDTMVNLAQAWAEAYMKKTPGVDISVQGGGSGTGISALINGITDICDASRFMKPKEIQQCKQRNFIPVATEVALDGVSIAVNTANPVKTLTIAQLKGIYTGAIKNWKEVGGKDAPIAILSRESSSGTYVYFQDEVLGGQKYAQTALLMPSTKAIQQEVHNNPNAIGYGGVAYFKGQGHIKIVPVAAEAGKPAIEPTDANVRVHKYPLSRPLLIYTAGKPKGIAASYINFMRSAEGQKIVEEQGYVSMK